MFLWVARRVVSRLVALARIGVGGMGHVGGRCRQGGRSGGGPTQRLFGQVAHPPVTDRQRPVEHVAPARMVEDTNS
jgi:hypothetical protein